MDVRKSLGQTNVSSGENDGADCRGAKVRPSERANAKARLGITGMVVSLPYLPRLPYGSTTIWELFLALLHGFLFAAFLLHISNYLV
jgi:hypothetical protein